MKKKRKWLIPVIISVAVLSTLYYFVAIFLMIPHLKMTNCICNANGTDVQRYEDGITFIDYDEYIKLRVVSDDEADKFQRLGKTKLTDFRLNDGKFEHCLKYSIKIFDEDGSLLAEKGQTCRFVFSFQKLKWHIDSVTVENI